MLEVQNTEIKPYTFNKSICIRNTLAQFVFLIPLIF